MAGSTARERSGSGDRTTIVVDRGRSCSRYCCRGAAARRRLGLPDREPARPAARALRPVVAGARRRAGAARGGRARRRRRRIRRRSRRASSLAALADAAERAPRPGARPPRTSCRRRSRRSTRRRCRWRWSPNSPTPRRACCWPAASTTTPCATPWRCGARRWCGCCTSAEPRRCQRYFEIAERAAAAQPSAERARHAHVGARGAARRGRRVLLFCGSDPATTRARRAGGSRSAARWNRGRRCPTRRCASSPRRRVCASAAADLVGPVWRREAVFDFNGSVIRSEEMFFVYRTARFEPSTGGSHRARAPHHPRPPMVR